MKHLDNNATTDAHNETVWVVVKKNVINMCFILMWSLRIFEGQTYD